MILGAHESIAGSPAKAFERGLADGAKSIQVFTKNARGWAAKPLDANEVHAFREARKAMGCVPVAHASYLINLAAPEGSEIREKSIAGFAEELARCEALGIGDLVVHPGGNPNLEEGLTLISEGLEECFRRAGRTVKTRALLEITAGQGSSIGHRFEHLAFLVSRSRRPGRLGICLDTCHLHAAGYDLTTATSYKATFASFEKLFDAWGGLACIGAFHLNDCMKPLGCRVDRHADLGTGSIGMETFSRLVRDRRFAEVPGMLETPTPEKYGETLGVLRKLAGGR